MQLFIDNWSATLLAPATASAVSLSVEPAKAALLAGLGGGAFYRLTLVDVDPSGTEVDWDVVEVTAVAAGVLTVARTATARSWSEGAIIEARLTAAGMADLRDKADSAVQAPELTAGLAGKVDKVAGKGLSSNDYTGAEKSKLAGLESSHFKGLYASLAALQSAHPSAIAGDYADVDAGAGLDVVRYLWDVTDSQWVAQAAAGGNMTPAQVKTAYESNPDTNAFTDAEQAKLAGIAAGATANANTDSLGEGPTNKYFTEGRVRSTVLTGLSLLAGGAISAADSLLSALGKLQKQISDVVTAIGSKQDTLVSGTNIKTVNGNSLLGSGDLAVSGGGGGLTAGTSQDLAGVSSRTFSIPAGVKRITGSFYNVVTSGSTYPAVLLGTSGGFGGISYQGSSGGTYYAGGSYTVFAGAANGFRFVPMSSDLIRQGTFIISLVSGTTWVLSVSGGASNYVFYLSGGCSTNIGGLLTQVKFQTDDGQPFTAGTINLMWE